MSIHGVNGLNGVSAANQVSSVKRNDVSENASKPVARDEMEISTQNRAEAAASVSFDSEGIRVISSTAFAPKSRRARTIPTRNSKKRSTASSRRSSPEIGGSDSIPSASGVSRSDAASA